MNETPAISPAVGPPRSITYEFTRWDLFANWMTVIFRNRILRVFMPVMMVLTGWLDLGPGFLTRSFLANMFAAGVSVAEFLGAIAIFQTLVALANAFLLKHGGVVGQHVLEITEQGLVERTDCNETLHRWPSICRIFTLGGSLYIYVSDNESHQIPKRYFSPQEIDAFEADLRIHARQLGS